MLASTWILCFLILGSLHFSVWKWIHYNFNRTMSWHLICKNPNRIIGVRSQTPCLFQNTGHASSRVLGLSFSSTKLTHHFILITIERDLVIDIVTSLCQFSKYKTFYPWSIETTMYSDEVVASGACGILELLLSGSWSEKLLVCWGDAWCLCVWRCCLRNGWFCKTSWAL